jgi:hypothetical protein
MNLLKDTRANTEMIPMVVYIFILTLVLFTLAFVISPSLSIIHSMSAVLDTSGSIYYDVESRFDLAVKAWFFLLPMMVAVKLLHLGLLAIKKQRYTGGSNESDFQ